MKDIFYNYFYSILRPFKAHRQYAFNRDKIKRDETDNLLMINSPEENMDQDKSIVALTIEQAISVSWVMAIIGGIYSVSSLYLGIRVVDLFENKSLLLDAFMQKAAIISHSTVLFMILVEVVLFPLMAWCYARIWTVVIKFFIKLYNEDEVDFEEKAAQTVSIYLGSHAFLLIPVFGKILQFLSSMIYLFAGLRNNFKLTHLQSAVILLSPLVVIGLTVILLIIYTALIISVIIY